MTERDRPGVGQKISGISSLNIRFRPENQSLARRNEGAPRPAGQTPTDDVEELKGVYIISVAARLLAMHPQTLRKYERLGLVSPSRTIGMLRLYSEEDIEKLRLIRHLEENLGLNLAGVEFTLNLLDNLMDMHRRLSAMKQAKEFLNIVEQEIAQLFQKLDLPLGE